MMAGRFSVDVDQMQAVIARMSTCEQAMEALGRQVERDVARVQQHWRGPSATAQALAHAEWVRGLRDMRRSLVEIRGAATNARTNYLEAADANTNMWAQTR